MRRSLGIMFGLATQGLFAVTVWFLVGFLKGETGGGTQGRLWIDTLLTLQFAVVHSSLLYPATRQRLRDLIPGAFYGSFFCVSTCAGLLLTIGLWERNTAVLWELHGPAARLVELAFFGSWVALFYSLWLSGLGFQTGWTTWWHWFRHRQLPRRQFEPRGAYHWFRHPIYLSFLGLLWFTPVVTADRIILTGVWSVYIAIGSWLKDRRLEHYIGDRYRVYESLVPGYPFLTIGPLGLIPFRKPRTIPFPSAENSDCSQSSSKSAA